MLIKNKNMQEKLKAYDPVFVCFIFLFSVPLHQYM